MVSFIKPVDKQLLCDKEWSPIGNTNSHVKVTYYSNDTYSVKVGDFETKGTYLCYNNTIEIKVYEYNYNVSIVKLTNDSLILLLGQKEIIKYYNSQ